MSHLRVFHPPHDYQLLLEATLSAPGSDPLKTYLDDRKASKAKVYTWLPKPFRLSALVADPATPPTMVGTIFGGHFERGGIAITADHVEANLERLLYARRLDHTAPLPTELRYLMFGGPAELFLAHLITRPGLDQVLAGKITAPRADRPSACGNSAITLRIESSGHPSGAPLKEGDQAHVTTVDGPVATSFGVATPTEFYFENGDVAA